MHKTYEELSEDVCIDLKWLKKNLPKEMPKKALKNGVVDDEAFSDWYLANDIVPYRETLDSMGVPSGTIASWAKTEKIPTIPGVKHAGQKKKFLYARMADILAVVPPSKAKVLEKKEVKPEKITPASPKEKGALDLIYKKETHVTPAVAKVMLSNNIFVGQRPVRRHHVEHMKKEIANGCLWEGQIRFARLPDGHEELVDGQHLLTAMYEAQHSAIHRVYCYRVQSMEEVGMLYEKFNNERSVKTVGELVKSAINTSGCPCKSQQRAQMYARALAHFKFKADTVTGDYFGQGRAGKIYNGDRVKMLRDEENWPVIKFLESLYTGPITKDQRKQPIVVAIIWHFDINKRDAKQFWAPWLTGLIPYEDHSSGTDPRQLLHRWLTTLSITQHTRGRSSTEAEIFNTINKYWNMWRRGVVAGVKIKKPVGAVVPR
jgi:hypothetical protein